jgi:hypothetical protein
LYFLVQVELDILQRVLGTGYFKRAATWYCSIVVAYSLLIDPRSFAALAFHKSLMDNLEVNRRASKGGESEIPRPK